MEGTRLNLTMAKRVGSKMGKKPVRISNHGIWTGYFIGKPDQI